jgi:hypothetical protein
MKLLVAVITFALTLVGLFFIETVKSPKEDYAQIIEALKEGNINTAISVAPSPTKNKFQVAAPNHTFTKEKLIHPTPNTPKSDQQTSSALGQSSLPSPAQPLSPILTLTPIQTSSLQSASTPTPTYLPITTPTPAPAASHVFYTSSYRTAKYYYCDTDNSWKSLSSSYLKSYPSESALLQDYPSRILHEPCK